MTVYLLDLNNTLSENHAERTAHGGFVPLVSWLHRERYRAWLVELLRPHSVVLVTVRPVAYREATLARILAETGWSPDLALFATGRGSPPALKRAMFIDVVLPRFGTPTGGYVALESNAATRAMYARLGIHAVSVSPCPLPVLPSAPCGLL